MEDNHLVIRERVHEPWRRIAALLVVMAVFVTSFMRGELRVSAAPQKTVDITVTLNNDIPVSDPDETLLVNDGDELTIQLAFSNGWAGGERYLCKLPNLFSGLTEEAFKGTNAEILSQKLDCVFTKNGDGTIDIELTFKEGITGIESACVINFYAELNLEDTEAGDDWEFVSDGTTIIFEQEDTSGGGGGGPGTEPELPNPPRGPETDSFQKHSDFGGSVQHPGNQSYPRDSFNEDTDAGKAYYYRLRLNDKQNKEHSTEYPLSGTIKDILPDGMRLFIPNAPGDERDDWDDAYRSFSFLLEETRSVEIDGEWYFVAFKKKSDLTDWVNIVERLEEEGGRSSSYGLEDLDGLNDAGWDDADWDVPTNPYEPDNPYEEFLIHAQYFCNDDYFNDSDRPITYGSYVTLGYKIDTSGKIHIYAYRNKEDSADFEYVRDVVWSNLETDKCVPLRSSDSYNSVVITAPFTQSEAIQWSGGSPFLTGWSISSRGTDENGMYYWVYALNGAPQFTLKVRPIESEDYPGSYQDEFWVEIPQQTTSTFMSGKVFDIRPSIYFDQTNPAISASNEKTLTFKNTATYAGETKSHTATHTYNVGTASSFVTGVSKTVNKVNAAPDETLTYALQFRKEGNLNIPVNKFWAYDKLDDNLKFVDGSLEIYLDGILKSTSHGNSAQTNGDAGDTLMLKAEYLADTHQIFFINSLGGLSSTGEIKIVFQANVKEDAYGALIPNTFGTTVNTNVDHKLKIRKVDGSGSVIENNSASFSVGYTTDTNYETAALQALPKPDSTPITTVTTGEDGTIAFDYRLDDGEFYIKLTETDPPDGYSGLSAPIWIHAKRGADNAMSYELAQSNADVTVSKGNDGIVQITVSNEPGSNPPPEPPEPGSFKLTKRVVDVNIGSSFVPDPNPEFVFTVTFATATDLATPTDIKVSTDSFPDEKPFISGEKVSLKADETATFTGIPPGMTYEIMEEDYSAGGYTPAPGNDASGMIGESGRSVVFTNNYAPDVPPDNPPDNPPDDDDDDDDDPPPRQPPQNTPPPEEPDNPNDDDDFTPIGDTPVPLAELPRLTTIFDDGIPLARLPTSGASRSAKYTLTGLVALVLGFLLLKKERR